MQDLLMATSSEALLLSTPHKKPAPLDTQIEREIRAAAPPRSFPQPEDTRGGISHGRICLVAPSNWIVGNQIGRAIDAFSKLPLGRLQTVGRSRASAAKQLAIT